MTTDFTRFYAPPPFRCENCDFNGKKPVDLRRHLATAKHINTTLLPKKRASFLCECGKNYSHRASLYNHKKKCVESAVPVTAVPVPVTAVPDTMTLSKLMLELVKSNSDLQKQMLEVCKNSNNTIISNSHNKTFNLQFFLNEQCKDAMNIMEFVDSFNLQFADLEQVGEQGYVEGISNIIMKKLNEMEVCKRPIHCSDAKRETMYVKDNNVWGKENATCDKLRKAIKYISKKNSDLIPAWNVSNPLSNIFTSHVNDQYLQIVQQAMGGSGEVIDSENKIIRKLAKAVLIEK
jgi:hypothetical protein